MNKTYLYIGVAILIVAIGGVIISGGGSSQESTPNGGDKISTDTQKNVNPLPVDIELKDYDGNTVSLTDYIGTPLVINSWAIWCPFCVEELKDFAQVQQELGDQVIIIAIDRAERGSRVQSFTDDLGVTNDLIFLLDSRDAFYKKIGGFSMPETVFVNAEGNIVIHKRGPMEAAEIKEKIQSIL